MKSVFYGLLFTLCVGSSQSYAADVGSKDEAVKMVAQVQADYAKDAAGTLKAINEKKYADRDLYPFVFSLKGVTVAHGANAALVGKDLIDMKDDDGKMLIQGMIDIAKSASGKGWIDYQWPNPISKKIEGKTSYIEKMGDNFVGVGVYR